MEARRSFDHPAYLAHGQLLPPEPLFRDALEQLVWSVCDVCIVE